MEADDRLDYESWLTGIIAKRTPDVLAALGDLLGVALAKGRCTADDIRSRDFEQPNVIGACFKMLPRFGFEQETITQNGKTYTLCVKAQHEKGHGRLLPVWRLAERWKAEKAMTMYKNMFFKNDDDGQMTLAM